MWQLLALTVTLVVEVPIVATIVRRLQADKSLWRSSAMAAAASLLSHPFAWMASLEWMDALPYPALVLTVEACVIAAEAVFFRVVAGWSPATAVLASAAANIASASAGLLLWELI